MMTMMMFEVYKAREDELNAQPTDESQRHLFGPVL